MEEEQRISLHRGRSTEGPGHAIKKRRGEKSTKTDAFMASYEIYKRLQGVKRSIETLAVKTVFGIDATTYDTDDGRYKREFSALEAAKYWGHFRNADRSRFLILKDLVKTEDYRQKIENNVVRQAMTSLRSKKSITDHKKLRDAGIKKPRASRGLKFFKFATRLLIEKETQNRFSIDDVTETV